jgi:hypothetical protein
MRSTTGLSERVLIICNRHITAVSAQKAATEQGSGPLRLGADLPRHRMPHGIDHKGGQEFFYM